ncbi:MAG: hypothetical protein SXA11_22370 [Cyanobacteriota bacterium]|nr:hypothetical protein [Cyanobacteriota bacterium]
MAIIIGEELADRRSPLKHKFPHPPETGFFAKTRFLKPPGTFLQQISSSTNLTTKISLAYRKTAFVLF